MEDSRRHKNFMMIKNKMWEAFYKKPLPEQERQVWDYIYRQTKGWGCNMKELSTYIIAKDLNISDVNVRRVIRALLRKKRIIVKGKSKGIQEDYNLWTLERISSTKELEQIRSTTRANTLVLLEHSRSLIKETLKDKKKERALQPSQEEEKKEKFKKGLHGFIEDLKELTGKGKKNPK